MWIRPKTVPVGQVWLRFNGRSRNGVPAKTYQIRDMEEEHREQCLDLMMETFARDEPLCQVLDIKGDKASMEQIKFDWKKILDEQVSLACFTEEGGQPEELVGFNFLYVKSRKDEEPSVYGVNGEKWKLLLKTLSTIDSLVNVFEHYGVDHVMCGSGMTVLPEHRGQNIGARLIEAREPLCKALNIHASSTVFTAATSQALAIKCGYELLGEMKYEDLMELGVDLRGCGTQIGQLRGKRF